ncbi:hypothetical protein D3C74_319480 [compost metagenome]
MRGDPTDDPDDERSDDVERREPRDEHEHQDRDRHGRAPERHVGHDDHGEERDARADQAYGLEAWRGHACGDAERRDGDAAQRHGRRDQRDEHDPDDRDQHRRDPHPELGQRERPALEAELGHEGQQGRVADQAREGPHEGLCGRVEDREGRDLPRGRSREAQRREARVAAGDREAGGCASQRDERDEEQERGDGREERVLGVVGRHVGLDPPGHAVEAARAPQEGAHAPDDDEQDRGRRRERDDRQDVGQALGVAAVGAAAAQEPPQVERGPHRVAPWLCPGCAADGAPFAG